MKTPLLPDVHFGSADAKLPDWRREPDDDGADDDAEIRTPDDVIEMLGFDPAEDETAADDHGTSSGARKAWLNRPHEMGPRDPASSREPRKSPVKRWIAVSHTGKEHREITRSAAMNSKEEGQYPVRVYNDRTGEEWHRHGDKWSKTNTEDRRPMIHIHLRSR